MSKGFQGKDDKHPKGAEARYEFVVSHGVLRNLVQLMSGKNGLMVDHFCIEES